MVEEITYKTLDQVAQVIDSAHKTPVYSDSGYPMVRATDIKGGNLQLNDTKRVDKKTFEEFSKNYKSSKGDILITRVGSYGLFSYVKTNEIFCLGQNTAGIKPLIDSRYLYFCLLSPFVKNQIEQSVVGSTQKTLSLGHIKRLKIPIFKPNEMNFISKILSSLDDKIELNRQMNATLEAMARAVFKAWFVDFEPVRANSENRPSESASPEIAKLFPSEFENGIPKGWQEKPIIEFFRLIGGGTPKTSNPEFWNGEILWYSVVDAPNESDAFVIDTEKKITQLGLEKSSTRLLRKGITIISARGTVGKLAITGSEMTMNQSCYAIEGKFGDYFNFYVVKSAIAELKQKTHGAVFDTITQDTFKSINQVLPNQETITAYEDKVASIMQKIEQNLRQNQKLAEIRDSLLPRLISGKIRVSEAEKMHNT